MDDFQEIITESFVLQKKYIVRNGFVFTTITYPANVYDAIVIKFPLDVPCFSPRINGASYSLEEHITFINIHNVEKALIIANNIEFIKMCPSLKHLRIIPSDNAGPNFDYSPLYVMPQIKSLQCLTQYGYRGEFFTTVDCSRIKGLEDIHIVNSRYKNFSSIRTLKSLGLSHYAEQNIADAFSSLMLDTLSIFQSKIRTLDGIEKSKKIECLYLYHNRNLHDICALERVAGTLRVLRIDGCSKITDFSVLEKLENLVLLELSGSNELSNLKFLRNLTKLKTFVFSMKVKDGDLSACLGLDYVYCEKNHRYYNYKDADLPKKTYVRGNEMIEAWRRLE